MRKLKPPKFDRIRTDMPAHNSFHSLFPEIPMTEIQATIVPSVRRIQSIKDPKVLGATEKVALQLILRINNFYLHQHKINADELDRIRGKLILLSIRHTAGSIQKHDK